MRQEYIRSNTLVLENHSSFFKKKKKKRKRSSLKYSYRVCSFHDFWPKAGASVSPLPFSLLPLQMRVVMSNSLDQWDINGKAFAFMINYILMAGANASHHPLCLPWMWTRCLNWSSHFCGHGGKARESESHWSWYCWATKPMWVVDCLHSFC